MTHVLRVAAAGLSCVALAVAVWRVGQSHRAERHGDEERAEHAQWLAAQQPSPWEGAAVARVRWSEKAKAHQPACDATRRVLEGWQPLVGELVAHDVTPVEVRCGERFEAAPAVREFLSGRRAIVGELAGAELRPACEFCPTSCGLAAITEHLPPERLAAVPGEADALVVVRRHAVPLATGATKQGSLGRFRVDHEVLIVDTVGRREVARYRFVGTRPVRRHRASPVADTGQVVAAPTSDTLAAFMTQLLDAPTK